MTFSRSSGESGSRAACSEAPAPADALERLRQPGRVDRLQHVVDGVHRERLDRVLVERGDEDELRQQVRLEQPAGDFESGQARASERRGTRCPGCSSPASRRASTPSAGLAGDVHAPGLAEQEAQLLPRQLFVVDDERADVGARSGTGALRHAHLGDLDPHRRALARAGWSGAPDSRAP